MENRSNQHQLSVVIPCYNEENTLARCVERLQQIANAQVSLEIIIVDDGSTDNSHAIAHELARQHPEVSVISLDINQGKGAALRAGFQVATGDFVAVQDADLEYDPRDLRKLLEPLIDGEADVVLGSRFASVGAQRVLYFWHCYLILPVDVSSFSRSRVVGLGSLRGELSRRDNRMTRESLMIRQYFG